MILLTTELNSLPANVDALLPQDYGRIDRVLFKLNLLEQYQKIRTSTPSAKPYAKRASDRLARELQRDTWDALSLARGFIRELQEDVFPEDVIAEVDNNGVDVKVDRMVVRQFELVQMRLDFRNDAAHSSSARSEFTYRWDFDHDNLTENGWTVSHYFPYTSRPRVWALIRHALSQLNAWVREKLPILHLMGGADHDFVSVYRGPYRVSATLIQNWDGLVVPTRVQMEHPLDVERPAPISTAPVLTETMRLCLALGLAVLGLIAGAKEQLLKLDVFPALIAIFLIGFGADQIKNLLSQRSQT